MNIAIIAMLPILCYQIQNQVNEITKEYIQFEPLIKDFDTQEGAINYSIERITEHLNSDNPKEYSVHINNKKNRIISEALGRDSSVNNYAPLKQLYNKLTTSNYSQHTPLQFFLLCAELQIHIPNYPLVYIISHRSYLLAV